MLQINIACEGVLKTIRSIIRSVETQSKLLEQQYGFTGPQLLILKKIPALHYHNFINQFALLPEWKQNQTLTALQHVAGMFKTKLSADSAPLIASSKELL